MPFGLEGFCIGVRKLFLPGPQELFAFVFIGQGYKLHFDADVQRYLVTQGLAYIFLFYNELYLTSLPLNSKEERERERE